MQTYHAETHQHPCIGDGCWYVGAYRVTDGDENVYACSQHITTAKAELRDADA